MIKHYSNGKKYLCQTKREDWLEYKGSGNLVRNDDTLVLLHTELLGEFETKEELRQQGIFHSERLNVVKDSSFLNLTIEEGQGGYTSYSEERNKKISEKLSGIKKSEEAKKKLSNVRLGKVSAWNKEKQIAVVVSREEFEDDPNLIGIAAVKAKGVPKSEEWKQKMRVPNPKKGEFRKGIPPANSKKVFCEGKEFPSVKHAADFYNKDRRWIERRIIDPSNKNFLLL